MLGRLRQTVTDSSFCGNPTLSRLNRSPKGAPCRRTSPRRASRWAAAGDPRTLATCASAGPGSPWPAWARWWLAPPPTRTQAREWRVEQTDLSDAWRLPWALSDLPWVVCRFQPQHREPSTSVPRRQPHLFWWSLNPPTAQKATSKPADLTRCERAAQHMARTGGARQR